MSHRLSPPAIHRLASNSLATELGSGHISAASEATVVRMLWESTQQVSERAVEVTEAILSLRLLSLGTIRSLPRLLSPRFGRFLDRLGRMPCCAIEQLCERGGIGQLEEACRDPQL